MSSLEFKTGTLADICTVITDGSHFSPAPQEDGFPIVNAKDIPNGRVVLDTCTRISKSDYDLLKIQNCAPNPGDVLLSKDGTIGRVVHYKDDLGVVLLSSVAILRPDQSTVAPHFLAQALRSHIFNQQLFRLQSGSALKRLVLSDIRKIQVPLPKLNVQAEIAKVLSIVDEVIEQTEALIAKYQQIKAGLMHDLFTRGVTHDGHLRPTRAEAPHLYKESPIGWIPEEWEVKPLESVAQVDRGKFTVRPRNDPRFYEGPYPFIQTGDVALSGNRTLRSYSQSLNKAGLSVSRLFPPGTIMVTIAANIADTCILGIPMCAPDSLVGVQPKVTEDARFIELSIRRRKPWLESRAPQTAQRNINLEDLRPLLISWPVARERTQISDLYECQDAVITSCESQLGKLRKKKQGLMHDLLTGRVRVKVEELVESAGL